jgi:hypothetical protein
MIRWRGAVKSAIKGKRGQAFLREMLTAMDAMPEKKLIAGELVTAAGEVCAIGSVMVKRGIDASQIDIEDYEQVADVMGISEALVREIEYVNDYSLNCGWNISALTGGKQRFIDVRRWISRHIVAVEDKEH